MSWEKLLSWAVNGAPLRSSHIHGEEHWRAVALTGLVLSKAERRISTSVILAFAICHDSRRIDESFDEDHGIRAAQELRANKGVLSFLGEQSAQQVITACDIHSHAQSAINEDISVRACLDSDRFNLLRLGFSLKPARFSLKYHGDNFKRMSELCREIIESPPSWPEIIAYVKEKGG